MNSRIFSAIEISIIREIDNAIDGLTAKDLVVRLTSKNKTPGTVYNPIVLLQKRGMLTQVNGGAGKKKFILTEECRRMMRIHERLRDPDVAMALDPS